jgi:putative transposase
MKRRYQVVGKEESKQLSAMLVQEGQQLLPLVRLVTEARLAVDELVDVMGRATIEAVLTLSAQEAAGPKHQGRRGGTIGWHGSQAATVPLAERKWRVRKPRLRHRDGGEATIPAFEAIRNSDAPGERMLEILLHGVSTRRYEEVLPAMAETVGVSKSAVSREWAEVSAKELEALMSRRLAGVEFLVLFLDGMVFGQTHIVAAVGVDAGGRKQVLGVVEGASENTATCVSLLEGLVARGLDPQRHYLFVIDGSKGLRGAIDKIFRPGQPVQRCRSHKVRNVCDKLPKHLKDQVKATLKAAYRLEPLEGISRLKKQAEWLEGLGHPDAAASLREGLEETFTINRLGLSPKLRRCLGTTNLIESPNAGVRLNTRRVTRWRNGTMVLRWAATAFAACERRFNRLQGYQDLWMLRAALADLAVDNQSEAM